MNVVIVKVKPFPKRCQWRDARIARLESLLAAIDREIERLKWIKTYCEVEQASRTTEARWNAVTR